MSELRLKYLKGDVSSGNSSTTPLAGAAVFTGTAVEILNYGTVFITVYADVASATDGLSIQQSTDGTNWDHSDTYTVPAGTGKNYSINPHAQYLRVVYTNGAGAQSTFRLQTVLKGISKPSSHRALDDLSMEDDCTLSKTVLASDSGDGSTLKNLDAHHPLAINDDSVYESDVDQDNSTSSGFTGGAVIDLFNDRSTTLINSAATNPKVIEVTLKRAIQTNILGFTAASGSFSNTKVIATIGQGVDAVSTTVIDESADNTDKTLLIPQFAPLTLTKLRIEFHTADACSVSYIGISKTQQRIARLQGVDPDGLVQDVNVTKDGFLAISDNSSGLAIAKGDVTGHSFIHKFGEAPDFDTGDGIVTVWDGADDGYINQMVYQYSSSADIDSISSSDAGDTVTIEVQGLDTSGNVVTQTATLSGQTRVALGTSLKRVFRMRNTGATDLAGYVYGYVNSAITGGVPDDPTQVRAVIQGSYNQTLMSIYTVPTGYTAYLRSWYGALAGASKTTNYKMYMFARPSGGVFQLKHKAALSENGTSMIRFDYVEPEVFAAGTDIEMRTAITAGSITAANVAAGFDIVLVAD